MSLSLCGRCQCRESRCGWLPDEFIALAVDARVETPQRTRRQKRTFLSWTKCGHFYLGLTLLIPLLDKSNDGPDTCIGVVTVDSPKPYHFGQKMEKIWFFNLSRIVRF